MQGGADSAEFRIPDSELEGSVELRVPNPQPARLTLVPSDKILFPRRMLYVEAVLYVTVAASAFGLGYLAGRGPAPGKDDADVLKQVAIVGKVLDAHHGASGAVVIVLPAGKAPEKGKRLSTAGLRPPDGPSKAANDALAAFGGKAVQAEAAGAFSLRVANAGSYHILALLPQAAGAPDRPPDDRDVSAIEKYFDAPADLLKGCRYCWLTKDIDRSSAPIEVRFGE